MNVACDYEAPMQMLTTEKYIASRPPLVSIEIRLSKSYHEKPTEGSKIFYWWSYGS